MKNNKTIFLILLITILLMSLSVSVAAAEDQPVARAILFYSTTCGHCEYVITQVLPQLFEEFGGQFVVMIVNAFDPNDPHIYLATNGLLEEHEIDITQQTGSDLFYSTLEEIGFPTDQAGVPFLLVGDEILIGSGQIPEQLPVMIADSITADGIDWPQYQAVQDFMTAIGFIDADGADLHPMPVEIYSFAPAPTPTSADPTPEPVETATEEPAPAEEPEPTLAPTEAPAVSDPFQIMEEPESDSLWETLVFRFNHDRTANTIAVIVLLILIAVVVYIAINFMRAAELKQWPEWILPVLLVIGLAIAGYLASIEISGTEAICGPVGDCNAVQQSKYATLFGFLPVAIFGILGYLAIGGSWLIGKMANGQLQFYAKLAMFFAGIFGLLFFIYLTFLEPFVIGATCAWCITSAIIMAIINLFTLPIVLQAWADLDDEDFELSEED